MLTLFTASKREVLMRRPQVCTVSSIEMAYPAPFEAILRAEVTLYALLETGWALQ